MLILYNKQGYINRIHLVERNKKTLKKTVIINTKNTMYDCWNLQYNFFLATQLGLSLDFTEKPY